MTERQTARVASIAGELRKLSLVAGDIVVCVVDGDADPDLIGIQLTAALPAGVRAIVTPYDVDKLDPYDDVGPFDGDELVRWAESYGHPEGWVKRAQAAHIRAERLAAELHSLCQSCPQGLDAPEAGPSRARAPGDPRQETDVQSDLT